MLFELTGLQLSLDISIYKRFQTVKNNIYHCIVRVILRVTSAIAKPEEPWIKECFMSCPSRNQSLPRGCCDYECCLRSIKFKSREVVLMVLKKH